MSTPSKVTTPHAAVIVWNYSDRINASGAEAPHLIEQVVVNTASLISISTSKSKSSPAGSFELNLAPTFNWVARLTPGSWCVILMSQDKRVPEISSKNPGKADENLVKMLGRIESVRAVVDVDQETGARRTKYIVTGQDWGSVFDTTLYVDPIVRNNLFDKESAVGHAARLVFNNMLLEWSNNKVKLPTPTQVIDAIIKLWGAPLVSLNLDATFESLKSSASNPIKLTTLPTFSSTAQFQLPKEVASYFGFGNFTAAVNFADLIRLYSGVLKSYDKYSGDQEEAYGIPDPAKFYGTNSFWQLLVENSNVAINELVTDMRWESGKAKLALYNRARPFVNRNTFEGSAEPQVQKNISKFENIRRIEIPLGDVLSINAGTNWRDKVNFVEIRLPAQFAEENYESQIKIQSQTTDRKAYERDGFKPLIQVANYMPFAPGQVGVMAPLEAIQWRFLLREWHFNTHLMLNGAASFVGQNQYIQVGDNIMIDAKVLGDSSLNSFQAQNPGGAFLLAHVESVNHQFVVTPDGARTFVTTVQFVRGIISDKNGKMLGVASGGLGGAAASLISSFVGGGAGGDAIDGALDRSAKDLETSKEKTKNVLGSSTKTDPDKDKMSGN